MQLLCSNMSFGYSINVSIWKDIIMKKLLLIIFLIPNLIIAETISTDDSNKYLKNFECNNNLATFNAVNKTNDFWHAIEFTFYDIDNDPVDNERWGLNVNPRSGDKGHITTNCSKFKKYKYKVKTISSEIIDMKSKL